MAKKKKRSKGKGGEGNQGGKSTEKAEPQEPTTPAPESEDQEDAEGQESGQEEQEEGKVTRGQIPIPDMHEEPTEEYPKGKVITGINCLTFPSHYAGQLAYREYKVKVTQQNLENFKKKKDPTKKLESELQKVRNREKEIMRALGREVKD